MISHRIMGGKVYVYRRENSKFWQCSTHIKNHNHRHSTNEESLEHAKQIAEDWYLELRGKLRVGMPVSHQAPFRAFSIAAARSYRSVAIISACKALSVSTSFSKTGTKFSTNLTTSRP